MTDCAVETVDLGVVACSFCCFVGWVLGLGGRLPVGLVGRLPRLAGRQSDLALLFFWIFALPVSGSVRVPGRRSPSTGVMVFTPCFGR